VIAVSGPSTGFIVDEEPLRAAVLKAYHAKRKEAGRSKRALDAVRQLLSGAPGGESILDRYWFEEDPPASIRSFAEDLEKTARGLAQGVFEPLLGAVRKMEEAAKREVAPNVAVYVSSLAGPLALKHEIDEAVAASVLSAALIALSRLGRGPFEEALAESQKDPKGKGGTK
jgi:hypothetical protein